MARARCRTVSGWPGNHERDGEGGGPGHREPGSAAEHERVQGPAGTGRRPARPAASCPRRCVTMYELIPKADADVCRCLMWEGELNGVEWDPPPAPAHHRIFWRVH